MRLELVSIETSTYPLDGAFYQPESGAGKGAILIMHGNCGNFYTGVPRHFAPLLVRLRASRFCTCTRVRASWGDDTAGLPSTADIFDECCHGR